MKKLFLAIGVLFSLGLSAQTHYYWQANSDFTEFGRIIDIKEVSPNVVAIQSFKLTDDYTFKSGNLSLYDLKADKEGESIILTGYELYRGGFGKMADGSLVLNTISTDKTFSLLKCKPNLNELTFTVNGKITGSFPSIPGGIVPINGGGYVMASSLPNQENGLFNVQLFKKSKGHVFGMEGVNTDQKMTTNLLMKPFFLKGMHNVTSVIEKPNVLDICNQVSLLNNEKVLVLKEIDDENDKNNVKIIMYNQTLEKQWELGFSNIGYGYRPITTGQGNTWFLTTFSSNGDISNTTIQKYEDNNSISKKTIKGFEANGSITLKTDDICVYGFNTHTDGLKVPAFYVLNSKNLEVKKSWELTEKEEPCEDLGILMGQEITLPGKFYTATEMENGDVIFGGHIISYSTVKNRTTKIQTTFNYMMLMPSSFF